MPPVMRIQRLDSVRRQMKQVCDDLARAVRFNNLMAYKAEARRIHPLIEQLVDLEADTRTMSVHGYTSNKKARRALALAARELDGLIALLLDWEHQANSLEHDAREMARLNLELLKFTHQMKLITFAPDIPRPRLSKEELAQIEAAETSVGTERAYTNVEILKHVGQPRYATPNISVGPTIQGKDTAEETRKLLIEARKRMEEYDSESKQALDKLIQGDGNASDGKA